MKNAEFGENINGTIYILNIKSDSDDDNIIIHIKQRSVVLNFSTVLSGVTHELKGTNQYYS